MLRDDARSRHPARRSRRRTSYRRARIVGCMPGHLAGSAAGVRRHGGRQLSKRSREWTGVRFELARWTARAAGGEGFIRLPDHLVFVTFSGTTRETTAVIEGAPRYAGADFPGAVTFVPAHRERRAWHRGGQIEYAAIRLDPLHAVAADDPRGVGGVEYRGFTNRPDPFVHQVARALRDEAISGGIGGSIFVDSLTTALSLHLARKYSNMAPRTDTNRQALAGKSLSDVVSFIQDELSRDLRLTRLASVAGMDRSHFCRAFKEATGRSPHRYVLERRVERAAEFLTGSRLPISEIALAVGFSSQSHLTTAFRRSSGETPHAFRAARRNASV